ncbi:DNA polymerase IV [Camelliibacillus cellulosilyticus]|uniref:DNA polymerase IV n=1 Tax=Camelliibacillus cellulosilyticus TaxID=2174486 RepID=A0ABV9GIH1_9BACL
MAMQKNTSRVIFHIDMNCFYASVEAAHHPELRGKPLAIAGKVEDRRGIVVTSSYEARAKGVKTTMPVWQARKLCPDLIVKLPDFERYRRVSRELFQLLRSYTPLVEKVSIDEGYLDVTAQGLTQHPIKLAQTIQNHVKQALNLPSSIGIAPNKFLAKMASDMKKPMGLTVLRKRDLPTKLWPLPVGDMHGVGAKTAEKLNTMGVYTIGDLVQYPKVALMAALGQHGEKLHDRASGLDDRPVDPEAEATFKSMSQSTTLPRDAQSEDEARGVFKRLAARLAQKLKEKKSVAYQIAITIRYSDWQTITRAKTIRQPIQTEVEIFDNVMRLFHDHWDGRPIRLLGVGAQNLEDASMASKQLDLFTYEQDAKQEPLYEAIQRLEKKYGSTVVQKGADRLNHNQDEN